MNTTIFLTAGLVAITGMTAQGQSKQGPSNSAITATRTKPTVMVASPIPANDPMFLKIEDSLAHSKQGDDFARRLAWKQAKDSYQEAVTIWENNPYANYGLARCYHALGDNAKELDAYRASVYSINPADKGFRETDTEKLMEFALLLSRSGQAQESVYVYHRAVAGINYIDGKQNLKVLLPTFGDGEGQVPYSPQVLQAMAHVGIAAHSQDDQEKLANLDEAIRLQPDMPQAYYYKGQALAGKPGRSREALAAYQTARRFAGIDTQLLIDQVIKENDIEKAAAAEQKSEKRSQK